MKDTDEIWRRCLVGPIASEVHLRGTWKSHKPRDRHQLLMSSRNSYRAPPSWPYVRKCRTQRCDPGHCKMMAQTFTRSRSKVLEMQQGSWKYRPKLIGIELPNSEAFQQRGQFPESRDLWALWKSVSSNTDFATWRAHQSIWLRSSSSAVHKHTEAVVLVSVCRHSFISAILRAL